jgi:hypothetical protein
MCALLYYHGVRAGVVSSRIGRQGLAVLGPFIIINFIARGDVSSQVESYCSMGLRFDGTLLACLALAGP